MVPEEIVCGEFNRLLRSDEEDVHRWTTVHAEEALLLVGLDEGVRAVEKELGTLNTNVVMEANKCASKKAAKDTNIDLYMHRPDGATCWFWSLVLTKSMGKTHVTPMIPAIPPLMIFGSNLKRDY